MVRTYKIKGEFGLWEKLKPVINRKGVVGAREYTEEVAFEGLDAAFSVVDAVVFGRAKVIGYELRCEEIQQGRRFFIVEDLDFELVSEIAKEVVGGQVGGA